MKSTGIVRKLDQLNRFVIPKELIKTHKLEDNASLEIFTEGENIVLRKYNPGCVICDSMDDLIDYKGKKICKSCKEGLHG